MAIKEIRREWSACQLGYVCEFMLHTEADVKDLPICCVGSVAHVSETNRDFVCNGKRWLPREGETIVILSETTVEIDPDSGEGQITEPLSADLVVGNKYTVTSNGVEHVCPAQAFDMNGFAFTALGNLGALTGGDDTGEPFAVLVVPPEFAAENGHTAIVYPLDGAETVTISITAKTELVNESESAGGGGAGAGSGGGGVFYASAELLKQEYSSSETEPIPVYADASLTTQLTYEQGKKIASQPCSIAGSDGGVIVSLHTPFEMMFYDEAQAIAAVLFLAASANMNVFVLKFADSVM